MWLLFLVILKLAVYTSCQSEARYFYLQWAKIKGRYLSQGWIHARTIYKIVSAVYMELPTFFLWLLRYQGAFSFNLKYAGGLCTPTTLTTTGLAYLNVAINNLFEKCIPCAKFYLFHLHVEAKPFLERSKVVRDWSNPNFWSTLFEFDTPSWEQIMKSDWILGDRVLRHHIKHKTHYTQTLKPNNVDSEQIIWRH